MGRLSDDEIKKIASTHFHEKLGKAKILAVGHIVDGQPQNWTLDCEERIPAVEITADGQILYGGYSIEELEEISKNFWGLK